MSDGYLKRTSLMSLYLKGNSMGNSFSWPHPAHLWMLRAVNALGDPEGKFWTSQRVEGWISRSPAAFARRRIFLSRMIRNSLLLHVLSFGFALLGVIGLIAGLEMTAGDSANLISLKVMGGVTLLPWAWWAALSRIRLLKGHLSTSIGGPLKNANDLPSVVTLRASLADSPQLMLSLDLILSALSGGRTSRTPDEFVSLVRRELGEADARGLVLMLAMPNAVDAPRGGEAQELLSRVAELAKVVVGTEWKAVEAAHRASQRHF